MKEKEAMMRNSKEVLEDRSTSSMGQQNEEKKTNKLREEMVDRLSSLPDEILHHILSFLDTKIAVRTSVLSKRWRYIWIGLSTLCFRLNSFNDSTCFKNFVKHVFLHRDESKSLFKIICFFDIFYPNWLMSIKVLKYLVSYGQSVQNLVIGEIDLELFPPFLPQVLTWGWLRTLKFHKVRIPNSTQFDLVSLTTLHLVKCLITWDNGDTYDLFRGCLRLENLELASCVWCCLGNLEGEKKVVISAPQLSSLKMLHYSYDDSTLSELQMVISSPMLTFFTFEGFKIFDYSFSCLPLLEKVDVDVGHHLVSNSKEDHQRLINVFQAVGHAKFVTLSHDTIHVLSEIPEVLAGHLSPFKGVKLFKIRLRPCSFPSSIAPHSMTVPSCVMTYLLSASPSAEAVMVEYVQNQKMDLSPSESDSDM